MIVHRLTDRWHRAGGPRRFRSRNCSACDQVGTVMGERLLILVGLNLLLWAALLGLWWLGGREPRRRH